jgi:hypothetical protein
MKTPREILFERHRQSEPRLDVVRRKALALLPVAKDAARAYPEAVLKKVWLELIWSSRRSWAGMAAIWLAVLAANLEMNATSQAVPAVRSVGGREWVQGFEEQRRLLAELLPPLSPPPATLAPANARPRSERPTLFKGC